MVLPYDAVMPPALVPGLLGGGVEHAAVVAVDDAAGVGLVERGDVDGADSDFAGSTDC